MILPKIYDSLVGFVLIYFKFMSNYTASWYNGPVCPDKGYVQYAQIKL